MHLEQDLLALREKVGLTQVKLAQRSGIPQNVISRLERGRARNLELRTLVRIAAALGARVRIRFELEKTAAAAAKGGKRKRAAA